MVFGCHGWFSKPLQQEEQRHAGYGYEGAGHLPEGDSLLGIDGVGNQYQHGGQPHQGGSDSRGGVLDCLQ